MTSPLLIVLSSRKGNYWVLTSLPFIRDYCLTRVDENGKIYDHLQVTLRFGVFPFTPFSLGLTYLRSTSFIRRILTSTRLSLTRLGMTFNSLGCLSLSSVMSQMLQILRFWITAVMQDIMKMYSFYIPPTGLVQTQVIQAGKNRT